MSSSPCPRGPSADTVGVGACELCGGKNSCPNREAYSSGSPDCGAHTRSREGVPQRHDGASLPSRERLRGGLTASRRTPAAGRPASACSPQGPQQYAASALRPVTSEISNQYPNNVQKLDIRSPDHHPKPSCMPQEEPQSTDISRGAGAPPGSQGPAPEQVSTVLGWEPAPLPLYTYLLLICHCPRPQVTQCLRNKHLPSPAPQSSSG